MGEHMKIMRKIIQIDDELCDGCGQCVPSCAEGSLEIVNGKARVVSDNLCDGLGACLGECPQGALSIVEREAEEFDEEAVEAYLTEKQAEKEEKAEPLACGCPSSHIQVFAPKAKTEPASGMKGPEPASDSALTHWPVQIRLVPPNAPFLKGADLLVLADCGAVSFPTLHRDFIQDRVVMMGCPKFDDTEFYVQRFAEIFSVADIRSITAVVMEVPCCSALPMIVKKAMERAKVAIPVEEVVISTRGNVLERRESTAG